MTEDLSRWIACDKCGDSVEWNEIETDNIIEPVDVYLNDDTEEEIPLDDEEEFVFDPINVVGGQ